MKLSYRTGYLLVALAALAPAGFRLLSWRAPRPQPVPPSMARAGQVLFKHVWQPHDPLCADGDGLGPVFNATSCLACHQQGGVGGSGGLRDNVTTFTVRSARDGGPAREGVVHAHALSRPFEETLAQVDARLPHVSQPSLDLLIPSAKRSGALHFPDGVHVSQRNTPALFGARWIDAIPDRVLIANERRQRLKWGLAAADREDVPVGRALRLADGHVGRFGWKAQTASLAEFVQAACANELGLGNPGHPQPRPLGRPDYEPAGLDLTQEQCDELTAFVASLPRPVQRLPENLSEREAAEEGKRLFHESGCADCHTPNLGSVEGIYSDLLLHPMGQPLVGGGGYGEPPVELPKFVSGEGPQPGEWRTPPLWGVADSAPYLHDGRAATLEEAIRLHAGQGLRAAQHFAQLDRHEQAWLVAFLKTLRAP